MGNGEQQLRVLIFGDSICVGQFISPHRTWVSHISQRMSEHFAKRICCTNASVNGNTTRMALERVPFDVQTHGIDVILVQFGMNDCNYWHTDCGVPRVSASAFAANLEEIVTRARIFGARAVVLATNHPTPLTTLFKHAEVSYQESNAHYNQIVREVAARCGASLIDHERVWLGAITSGRKLEQLLLPDGIHLGEAGHDLYLETVWPVLRGIVESLE